MSNDDTEYGKESSTSSRKCTALNYVTFALLSLGHSVSSSAFASASHSRASSLLFSFPCIVSLVTTGERARTSKLEGNREKGRKDMELLSGRDISFKRVSGELASCLTLAFIRERNAKSLQVLTKHDIRR